MGVSATETPEYAKKQMKMEITMLKGTDVTEHALYTWLIIHGSRD